MAGESIMALGAINEGKSAEIAGEYNAKTAEQNAQYSLLQSAEEENRARMASKKVIGDMRANFGASGITGGSALDVLSESSANAELDALTIRHEGKVKYASYMNDAAMSRVAGKNAKMNSYLKAAGYLASGAGNTAKQIAGAK